VGLGKRTYPSKTNVIREIDISLTFEGRNSTEGGGAGAGCGLRTNAFVYGGISGVENQLEVGTRGTTGLIIH